MSVTDTGTRGSRPGELHRRRVVLVAESAGLAGVLNHLLDPADRLSRLGSLRELADSRSLDSADVVVLDMPAKERAAAVEQVRRRYLGPLIVLVDRRAGAARLHLDDACTPLARPFSAEELAAAMAVPGRPAAPGPAAAPRVPRFIGSGAGAAGVALVGPPGWDAPAAPDPADGPAPADPADGPVPAAGPGPAASDPKAAARQAPVRPTPAAAPGRLTVIDRTQRLLVALTESWQARRRVRVAGFSAFALVAFTVAFALAAQGRCGPGCDALGTGFSPAPTIAPASSHAAPSTTAPKRPTTTVTSAGSAGTGVFGGLVSGRAADTTTTTERRATTTSRRAPATTRPATTRPATTATTAPTTTDTTAPPTTETTLPTPAP
jgi:hypothetical protein